MPPLSVRLFGKLSVQCNEQIVSGFEASKLREMFCYLLVHRHAPHTRETLAALLWGDSTTAQSKKYLRQTLYEIQRALHPHLPAGENGIFVADADWVNLNPAVDLWLDVAIFEGAFVRVNGTVGAALDDSQAEALRDAVGLYQGDLLEGCYQDWCLYERERLQSDYLMMLDKLMSWSEAHHEYEAGLAYGQRVMRYERARESTHRRLIRLYSLNGDRTSALRQYARCVSALAEELSVAPARRTVELYDRIRADEFESATPTPAVTSVIPEASAVPDLMDHLKELRVVLSETERQVQENIRVVDVALKARR